MGRESDKCTGVELSARVMLANDGVGRGGWGGGRAWYIKSKISLGCLMCQFCRDDPHGGRLVTAEGGWYISGMYKALSKIV